MRYWKILAAFLPLIVVIACQSQRDPYGRKPPRGSMSSYKAPSLNPAARRSAGTLLRAVNLKRDFVAKGRHGRWKHRSMRPRYITIHSTQNYTGDAYAHAKALKRGALRGRNRIGYLIWHFTVQDDVAIQHMPTDEQGEHADFDGPGNNYSIGIEMCEHRGNNREQTLDRTAKLAAYLMKRHGIPLRHVVPHYHWPRKGRNPANKNCPHFLMTNGHPGPKWYGFLRQVERYYRAIS